MWYDLNTMGLWLLAMIGFLAACIAVATRQAFWPQLTAVAAAISLIPTVIGGTTPALVPS